MKSIAAAGAVLALATTGTVVVQTQTAPAAVAEETANKPAAQANQIIDADMIASGRVTKASNLTDSFGVGKGLISGHVYLTSPNGNPGAAYDNGNKKLDGITVYAQFRDKDGSYSPIFSAKTHTLPDVVGGNGGQGTFAFGTGKKGITWTDQQGREHTWSALYSQKHRIWVEPFTNDRGNRVEMFRQANGWTPGSFNRTVDGPMGSFTSAGGNMQLMAAFLREVPPNHEKSYMAAKGDKLVEDPKGPISSAATQLGESNVLSGQVWLETGGSPDWGFPATGPKRDSVTQDPAADGYTVYASTLTKDGAAANKALQEKFKNDPDKLAEETKKMLEAHPSTSSRRSTARPTKKATTPCASVDTRIRIRPVRTSSTPTTCSCGLRTRTVSSRPATPASTPRSSSVSMLAVTSSRQMQYRLKTKQSPRELRI
ncbi:hypothetical protein ACN4D7_08260 [Corynebacterium macclintockiae]